MTLTATLKRRIRQLEQSRDKWKRRVAAKQRALRYLRVNVRDLTASRDCWKRRCSAGPACPSDLADPPVLLPGPQPASPTTLERWPAPVVAEAPLGGA